MDKEDTLVNKLPCGVKEVSPDMRPALVAFRYNVRSSNKNHFKGTKKRTEEDDVRFAQSFEKLLLMAQERRESE